jgi:hypothetical protein
MTIPDWVFDIEYKAMTLNNDWVHGSYVKQLNDKGEISHWMIPLNATAGVEIRLESLCLYTGRKDRRGRRIYQNDLIGKDDGSAALVVYMPTTGFFLRWGEGRGRATFSHVGRDSGFFVIGNICENPKLVGQISRWGKSYYKQKVAADDEIPVIA